ncbi:MAG: TIGR01777 family oxidoreductase [Phycisphaerales bacterium]
MAESSLGGKRIVIAGGSGFIGRSLAAHLIGRNAAVTILSRPAVEIPGAKALRWDGRSVGEWAAALDGADGLVNLAGRSVDCRKTPDHCDEILRSRVESTLALGAAISACDAPPPVWAQMSTAHIYGDPPTERCDESSALGYGLAPTVGRAWEAAFDAARPPSVRGVVLRTSFVVGRGGGALRRLSTLVRFGLGGVVGSGAQGMSWLHELDMNRIFERALTHEQMTGVYIASSPEPVSQRDFMRRLRAAMRMPIGLPAPEFLVRIGAPLVMRTDPELALYGRYVIPKRLLDEGFEFRFVRLSEALSDLFGR